MLVFLYLSHLYIVLSDGPAIRLRRTGLQP